jgi:hypothetical protein
MNYITFKCWITPFGFASICGPLSNSVYISKRTNNAVLCHFQCAAFRSSDSSHLLWNRDLYSLQHFHWETNYRNYCRKPVDPKIHTGRIHKTLEKIQTPINTKYHDATTPNKKHHRVGDRSHALDMSPLLISLHSSALAARYSDLCVSQDH